MTALNFPDSPAAGDIYDAPNGVQYQYDGVSWNVVSAAAGVPGPVGPAGPQGEAGPVGFKYIGRVSTESELDGIIGVSELYEVYIANDTGIGYQCVANSNTPSGKSWNNLGRLVGENGENGAAGVSTRYMGRINNYTELEALTPGAKGGQFYITNDTGEGYFAIANEDPNDVTAWEFMGRLVGQDGAEGAVGPQGETGPAGVDGEQGYSARYAGRVGNYTELEALTPNARPGQFYIADDTGEGYFALESSNTPGTVSAWEFMGRLVGQDGAEGPQGETGANGPAGAEGAQGEQGYSARYAGRIGNYTELEALTPNARPGQFYIADDTGEGYYALESSNTPGTVSAWEFMGRLVGQDGAEGPQGETGAAGPAGADGAQGEQGIPGLGLRFIARVATVGDLPATATQGDVYLIEATGDAHVWDETVPGFVNAGPVVGPTGAQGPAGAQGETGATGPKGDTGAAGPKGDRGDQGITGADGPRGPAGPSAVSADAGNASKLGTDGLIFTPASTGGTSGLPTTGGTMTGTIASPIATPMSFMNTYSLFSANGGVSFRFGATDLIAFSSTAITAYKAVVVPGTSIGVQFGSGGGYLAKGGSNGIGAYVGGQLRWTFDATQHVTTVPIKLPADPTDVLHAATKQYVDAKPTIVSMASGGTPPSAASYPENTLLVEYA